MISAMESPKSLWNRWRVVVLLGGDSAEREISLESGTAVIQALEQAGHSVAPLDPGLIPVENFHWTESDVAFIALHGTHGEDGDIQGRLDQLRVPYTGSNVISSSLAFHKVAAKKRFLHCGLATPAFTFISGEMTESEIHAHAEELGWPLVVKPEAQGSSLGVSILNGPAQLFPAIALARSYGDDVLLETAIAGQEWTVPVLDDHSLPSIRIGTPHPFFDFDAKYRDEETEYHVIIDSADVMAQRVQELSVKACQSLGCRGVSRVDLRVDQSGQPWLLEVNTIPGLTSHSLVPKSARALGWSMSRLCEEMIRSALQLGSAHSPQPVLPRPQNMNDIHTGKNILENSMYRQ